MKELYLYRIDGVLWQDVKDVLFGPVPVCPKHKLQMQKGKSEESLVCEECVKPYKIPRSVSEQRRYVQRKIDAARRKGVKVLNLDDEAITLAEAKIKKSKPGKYFVTAVLTESKVGQRLIIYAGERGKKEKTQVFVEPGIKRLSFDQNDLHPTDIFLKLEAEFLDGTKTSMEKKLRNK